MMKIRHILLAAGILFAATGCIRDNLATIHNEIDSFHQTKLKPIEDQLKSVEASVAKLESTGGVLDSTAKALLQSRDQLNQKLDAIDKQIEDLRKTTVEGKEQLIKEMKELRNDILEKVEVVNLSIEELEKKDIYLSDKLDSLEAYIENELPEGGFDDIIAMFKKLADIVAGIDVDVKAVRSSIVALDASLNTRLETIRDGLSDKLVSEFDKITEGYVGAISDAKTEILLTADEMFLASIDSSKVSILRWVDEDLLGLYYKQAEIDEMIRLLERSDSTNTASLNAYRTDFGKAKQEISQAIDKAIEDLQIDKKLADALSELNKTISSLKEDIETRVQSISTLFEKVKTLDAQMSAMQEAHKKLGEVDAVLESSISTLNEAFDEYGKGIKSVQSKGTDFLDSLRAHREAISAAKSAMLLIGAEIDALASAQKSISGRKDSLENAINILKNYIDGQVNDYKTWAAGSFVTFDEYKKTTDLIATIQANISGIVTNITNLDKDISEATGNKESELLKAVSDAKTKILNAFSIELKGKMETLEKDITGPSGWVISSALAEYMTAEVFNEKLGVLEKAYKDKDALHEKQITELASTVKDYEDKLSEKCIQCIKDALMQGGVIDNVISVKITSLQDAYDKKFEEIDGRIESLDKRLTSVEERIVAAETQLKNLNENIKSLEEADKTISDILEKLGNVIGIREESDSTVMQSLDSLRNKDLALKKMIEDLKQYAVSEEYKGTVDGWMNISLQSYKNSTDVDKMLAEVNAALDIVVNSLSSMDKERVSNLETRCIELMAAIVGVQTDFDKAFTNNEAFAGADSTSVKTRFESYYKKAATYDTTTVLQKLSSLYKKEKLEADIAAEIQKLGNVATKEAVADSVDKLKTRVEAAYKEYIGNAVKNDGVISASIQTAISNLNGEYTGTLKSLYDSFSGVGNKLSDLENVVQKVVYIPEYNDNSNSVEYNGNSYSATMRYMIQTAGSFDPKNYSYSFSLINTTKRGEQYFSSLTASYSGYAGGILTFVIDGEKLDSKFYSGEISIAMALNISDYKTNISSVYAPLFIPGVVLNKSEMQFNYRNSKEAGTSQKVKVTASGSWTATAPDWVSLSSYNGNGVTEVTVDVSRNYDADRSGDVVFTCSGTSKKLTVSQSTRGPQTIELDSAAPVMSWEGGTLWITVKTNDGETDWRYVKKENSSKFFSIDESKINEGKLGIIAPRSFSEDRCAYLDFISYDGSCTVSCTVKQSHGQFRNDINENGKSFQGSTTFLIHNDNPDYPYMYMTGSVMLGDYDFNELIGRFPIIKNILDALGITDWHDIVKIEYNKNDSWTSFPETFDTAIDCSKYPDGVNTRITVNNQLLLSFSKVLTELLKVPDIVLTVNLNFNAVNASGERYQYSMVLNISGSSTFWISDISDRN